MHPELFHINHLFGFENITIYTYSFCIVLGTWIASLYTKWSAKKELGIIGISNNFFYLVFLAGFVGGKIFFYLERPLLFWNNPSLLWHNFSGGFVFYGSFITIIPVVIWYLKRHKIPILPMLDILAITTTIVHSIGRLGCFFAGCCYGKPTDSFFGLVFPKTKGIPVHPSQLYEITGIAIIMLILFKIKKNKLFHGQIFLSYLCLYAVTRGILEIFRGDRRGFIIPNILSHSQFIAILIIVVSAVLYHKIKNKQLTLKHETNETNNF